MKKIFSTILELPYPLNIFILIVGVPLFLCECLMTGLKEIYGELFDFN